MKIVEMTSGRISHKVKIMNRKIMFFDIDGTIITEDTHTVPESAKEAIKKARENGHLAFINTGRTIFNIPKELVELNFDGYVCGCGTYIQTGEEVLLTTTIDEVTCRKIIDQLRKCKIDAVLEGLEDVYFDDKEHITKNMARIRNDFQKRGYGKTKNWDYEGLTYDKLFTEGTKESDIEAFIEFLKDDFDYIDRGNLCGEIVPKGYSKATGIQTLLQYYKIPLENAYAFGDSSNDLSMLEFVPNSVAMGKSDQCIYDIASYITKDIKEDGIQHALEHFHII